MKSLIIITLILGCSALMAVMFGAWWHLFTAAKTKVSQATAQAAAAPANVDTETGEVKEDNQPKKQ